MKAQHNLAALVRRIEVEGELVITRRRKPVAKLVPIDKPPLAFPDFKARAHKIWGGAWQGAESDALLDESRGAR